MGRMFDRPSKLEPKIAAFRQPQAVSMHNDVVKDVETPVLRAMSPISGMVTKVFVHLEKLSAKRKLENFVLEVKNVGKELRYDVVAKEGFSEADVAFDVAERDLISVYYKPVVLPTAEEGMPAGLTVSFNILPRSGDKPDA